MKKMLLVLFIVCLVMGFAKDSFGKNEKILNAIMLEESGGQAYPKGPNDGGKARGYFQIHWDYWQDACEYGGVYNPKTKKYKPGWEYKKGAHDKAKATQVVIWYMQRYERRAWDSGNYEILAKLHNGGINWRKYSSVKGYWKRVKSRLV